MSNPLNFKVSAGLKNIIGRDLIINDTVAIFELVKNSFDADAKKVQIYFDKDRIIIIDDGHGMTHDDLVNKWLFVAYSAKKKENQLLKNDYRNNVNNRVYAGSKGVGRFSCDRLGNILRLQTIDKDGLNHNEILDIEWDKFESDDQKRFETIKVYNSSDLQFILNDIEYPIDLFHNFSLTKSLDFPLHGTIIEIKNLRERWDRKKLLELRRSLAKLINPFQQKSDFEIVILAPHEIREDEKILEEAEENDEYVSVVNGSINNFIFDTLQSKSTHLEVSFTDNGESITSTLIDRGELIYKIVEPNEYELIKNSDFSASIYYLNTAAKATFKRRMGIRSVSFGSIFLFRNGFRVFPIGNEGDDTFHIDRRKQQGYARYLGTRDVVGKIDVNGTDEQFKEATSRDQGLIETPAYLQLEECFIEKCIRRLESYVVEVTWKDTLDRELDTPERLNTDPAKARVINIVSKLANAKKIEILEFSKNLISILNEKSKEFEESIEGLKAVARKSNDHQLWDKINKAEQRYLELKQAEELAKKEAIAAEEARKKAEDNARQAEKERREAEKQKQIAEQAAKQAEEEKQEAEQVAKQAVEEKQEAVEERKKTTLAYEEEKKRSLFLTANSSMDLDNIINLHHQIGIYSADIKHYLQIQIKLLNREPDSFNKEQIFDILQKLLLKNQQVLTISQYSTQANFRLDSDEITDDLILFINDYISNICSMYSGDKINLNINTNNLELKKTFKPIEVSILIDNFVSNSKKINATNIFFTFSKIDPKTICLVIEDNGTGLNTSVIEPTRIFEKGFTTSNGSGLGLYHIKHIIEKMGGSIDLDRTALPKVKFIIRFSVK